MYQRTARPLQSCSFFLQVIASSLTEKCFRIIFRYWIIIITNIVSFVQMQEALESTQRLLRALVERSHYRRVLVAGVGLIAGVPSIKLAMKWLSALQMTRQSLSVLLLAQATH